MVFPIQRPNGPAPVQRPPYNLPGQNQGFNGPPAGNNMQGFIQGLLRSSGQNTPGTRGAGGLTKTLNNVQNVLKVVQSTAPIVQQYGPMIKNLPMMYKMMKSLNDDDASDSNNDSTKAVERVETTKNADEVNNQVSDNQNSVISGESKPKLYI